GVARGRRPPLRLRPHRFRRPHRERAPHRRTGGRRPDQLGDRGPPPPGPAHRRNPPDQHLPQTTHTPPGGTPHRPAPRPPRTPHGLHSRPRLTQPAGTHA